MDFVLKGLIVLTCFVIAVPLGTAPVRTLLRRIARVQAPPDSESVPGIVGAQKELPGGYWIGLLERAALFASVLSGFPAGIAVVLGVKSIGRYPELRTPTGSKGELFIIGTFASMLWAAAFAGLAYGLVRLW
nr:hypothetical protein [Tessaracoccus sp. OS52]